MQIRVATNAEIPVIQQLAKEIWPSAYKNIISTEQINYMLHLMYSAQSIKQQMAEGCVFLIAENKNKTTAFAGYQPITTQLFKLHKLYVAQQGLGIGTQLIRYILNQMQANGAATLQLQVNKQNVAAQNFYKKLGFIVTEAAVFNIGNNFIMDDFIMEYHLPT
jgi:diamine N-acetyltransferase